MEVCKENMILIEWKSMIKAKIISDEVEIRAINDNMEWTIIFDREPPQVAKLSQIIIIIMHNYIYHYV